MFRVCNLPYTRLLICTSYLALMNTRMSSSLRKGGWAEEAGDGRGAEEREGVGSDEAAWGFVLRDGGAAQHESVHEAGEGAAPHDTELQRPDGPHLP